MGRVQLAEGELNYRLDGPQGAPVLVLSNSLGTDLHMWDIQIRPSPSIFVCCVSTPVATANPW